jgi:hypothetical protein
LGGRPAPGLRVYVSRATATRGGINGSTLAQKSSVTTHDSTRLVAIRPLRRRALCGSEA